MKQKFIELFEYNYQINKKVIELMNLNYNLMSTKSISLLSHILNAHQIWNTRITIGVEFGVWQLNNWNEVHAINDTNYEKTLKILSSIEIDHIIEYTNSQGKSFKNKVEDILFHIINHSTYHRAQIATECRNQGVEPLMTDYIMYKRDLENNF